MFNLFYHEGIPKNSLPKYIGQLGHICLSRKRFKECGKLYSLATDYMKHGGLSKRICAEVYYISFYLHPMFYDATDHLDELEKHTKIVLKVEIYFMLNS